MPRSAPLNHHRRRELKALKKGIQHRTLLEIMGNDALDDSVTEVKYPKSAGSKRPRERSLRQMINCIIKWRELHHGVSQI